MKILIDEFPNTPNDCLFSKWSDVNKCYYCCFTGLGCTEKWCKKCEHLRKGGF